MILMVFAGVSAAAEIDAGAEAPDLAGIAVQMRSKELVDNWGFPAKRDRKTNAEVWFYLNENTSHPTDGIVVYLAKNRVTGWKKTDNVYSEMAIWGKVAGHAGNVISNDMSE